LLKNINEMNRKTSSIVFAFCFLLCSVRAGAQVIYTMAGNGTAAFTADGVAATASGLNEPAGVAVDAAGNVYIADQMNNRVRKVNPAGIISTIGGTGVIGYTGDGGPATNAKIYAPRAITTDAAGNVFFSDYGNTVIRKISTTGIITTVAGNGFAGFSGDGAAATNARLNYAWGVAVDGSGNLYIADQLNNCIRKVTAAGIISTIAGTGVPGFMGDGGPAVTARLNNPTGIAVNAAGTVYIADYANNKVRKITTAGIISTIAGVGLPAFGYAGDGGPATAAHLYYPMTLAVDVPGNVYLCDRNNNCVRKIGLTGIINTIAGVDTAGFSGDGGFAIHAKLDQMTGVAVRDNGDIYIADNNNNRVRYIPISGAPYFTNGHIQYLVTCPIELIPIDTLLRIDDIDIGQTETWSELMAPTHGALISAYSALSTGSTVTPAGLQYAPIAGYTGQDSFKVRIYDGTLYDTTTVYVTIIPYPNAGTITGIDSVCPGTTRMLTDTTSGGTWTTDNATIATIGSTGILSALTAGSVTVSYTVTNACGSSTAVFALTVLATAPCVITGVPYVAAIGDAIQIAPNPASGTFELKIISPVDEVVNVAITDILGHKVAAHMMPTNLTKVLKLNEPSGIYFITARTALSTATSKVLITR
jgi:sugar lactone lactonase YvrE